MSSISKSESVNSRSLSSLYISTNATSSNKSQFEWKDNLFVNGALQPYRFQLDYVEYDEDESSGNSTDKDQNDEKLNSQQSKDKSYGHIE